MTNKLEVVGVPPPTRKGRRGVEGSGPEGRCEFHVDLDELVCEGARRMLAVALEEEVAAYIAAHAREVDERGHRLVRRTATPVSAW